MTGLAGTAGNAPVAAAASDPSGILNPAANHEPEDDRAGSPTTSSDPPACRDLTELSEVPDSQLDVPEQTASLLGQTGAFPTTDPEMGPTPRADKSTTPPAHAEKDCEAYDLGAPSPARAPMTPLPEGSPPPSPDQRDPQAPMQNLVAPVTPGPATAPPSNPEHARQNTHGSGSGRFASPPIIMRRSRGRATAARSRTLGEFLAAATKELNTSLPAPAKRSRRPLDFTPRRGRSATAAPPTAERRAQVQVLRTLGIVGTNQKISAAEMKAYDDLFAAPIPLSVLTAIAALVDREIPACLASQPTAPARVNIACET